MPPTDLGYVISLPPEITICSPKSCANAAWVAKPRHRTMADERLWNMLFMDLSGTNSPSVIHEGYWKMTDIASENVAGCPMGWRCQYWKFQVAPGVIVTPPAQGLERAWMISVAKVPSAAICPTSLS